MEPWEVGLIPLTADGTQNNQRYNYNYVIRYDIDNNI